MENVEFTDSSINYLTEERGYPWFNINFDVWYKGVNEFGGFTTTKYTVRIVASMQGEMHRKPEIRDGLWFKYADESKKPGEVRDAILNSCEKHFRNNKDEILAKCKLEFNSQSLEYMGKLGRRAADAEKLAAELKGVIRLYQRIRKEALS